MNLDLKSALVIGVASSALFDLGEADYVFQSEGEDAYRAYQREHLDDVLPAGVAFSFIQRLLRMNEISREEYRLVEVIVLSRNDPDTGLRVMRSIAAYGLDISRAIFMAGVAPFGFMPALQMSLFLSGSEADVRAAIARGLPAGMVVGSPVKRQVDLEDSDTSLRVAFDFDGVLSSDESERVYMEQGLARFIEHEVENKDEPLDQGPLTDLLRGLNQIQELERSLLQGDPSYQRRLRISVVTARNAPAHERAVHSLRTWGLNADDAFFLGGIEKAPLLRILNPHIYFDDQTRHILPAAVDVAAVHVPFGVRNTDRFV